MHAEDDDDESHVSKYLKWAMFVFNFFFWVISVTMIGIGTWAYLEKSNYDYGKVHTDGDGDGDAEEFEIYDLIFDLTIVMMGMGIMLFIIAFPGCLGALRENVLMLNVFMYMLGGLMALEMGMGMLAFVFSDELKGKLTYILKDEGVVRYRDDPDLRNFVDFVQERFKCCGVLSHGIDFGYQIWHLNPYYNCSSDNPSSERCTVPYSCCVTADDIEENVKNLLCAANIDIRDDQIALSKTIYTTGCVNAMIGKAKLNLFFMGGAVLAFTVPQMIDLYIGFVMVRDIQMQAGEYDY